MKICICCAKPTGGPGEFHARCMKALFDTGYIPAINFTLAEIATTAQKMAGKLSVSGVQPKLSMKLNKKEHALEVVAEGGEYILKPQGIVYHNLPQNEHLCMALAGAQGIGVPPHGILQLQDGSYAYIVKRFDRRGLERIHVEDFQQILGYEDKYRGSYEQIGKKLLQISSVPGLDAQLFYERILLNFILGNGDAHNKNFSIIYGDSGSIRLAPAYDIVSSKMVIPDEEDCALTLNGKKNGLTEEDFSSFAEYLGIPPKAIEGKFTGRSSEISEFIDNSPIVSQQERSQLKAIINERLKRLKTL